MQISPLPIPGAYVVEPRIHNDPRGSFHEWFRGDMLYEKTGLRFPVEQANWSVSTRGTIRGIHFAQFPLSQAKYVTCPQGAIWDVVVDIRVGSATYGKWTAVELTETNRKAVVISEGLGHAFMALAESTTAMYLCTTTYNPTREKGVLPTDSDINIQWPLSYKPILSAKDAQAPTLKQAHSQGILPSVEDCPVLST